MKTNRVLRMEFKDAKSEKEPEKVVVDVDNKDEGKEEDVDVKDADSDEDPPKKKDTKDADSDKEDIDVEDEDSDKDPKKDKDIKDADSDEEDVDIEDEGMDKDAIKAQLKRQKLMLIKANDTVTKRRIKEYISRLEKNLKQLEKDPTDVWRHKSKDEAPFNFKDSQEFKDAVKSAVDIQVKAYTAVREKAISFLDDTFDYANKTPMEIMKAAVEAQLGNEFTDEEIPTAFKTLKKSVTYKNFGDEKIEGSFSSKGEKEIGSK